MIDEARLLTDSGYVVHLLIQAFAEGVAVGAAMLAITLIYRRR